ncbi:MAG TPA: hypothetical protein PKH10_11995 [bacterium]|nr:hypothetical protein [bacterium]
MRSVAPLFPFLFFCLIVSAEGKDQKTEKPAEATVSFEKKEGGVDYTIAIQPPFKMNREAPFKFELRRDANDTLKKVALDEFAKDGKSETYRYRSVMNEKQIYYWFIACKYKGEEVVACKTFSAKQDLP